MQETAFSPEYPLTVSALNRCVRSCLESAWPLQWVSGEISNLTQASSGHLYFSLKDDSAQVRCVIWRHKAQLLGWRPQNGEKVDVRALVTLYEPRGDYQLNVDTLRRTGLGLLFQQFQALKERLEREGLFSPSLKRPLPSFPKRIGIITSPQAAALHDVLTTLRRRAPHIALTLYPTPVQGEGAATNIATTLAFAGRQNEDLLILCRGGGSLEDLWPFNEEQVARAIRASPVPVISGIGHEIDVSIADFAADQRAATPTAAAEMASPERAHLLRHLDQISHHLQDRLRRHCLDAEQRLDWLASRLVHPQQRLRHQATALLLLQRTMDRAFTRCLERRHHLVQSVAWQLERSGEGCLSAPIRRLERLEANLHSLNPLAVLERGYAIIQSEQGKIVRDSTQVRDGERVNITLAHGQIKASVTI